MVTSLSSFIFHALPRQTLESTFPTLLHVHRETGFARAVPGSDPAAGMPAHAPSTLGPQRFQTASLVAAQRNPTKYRSKMN